MTKVISSRKSCDCCGVRGTRLFLVRNLKELEGCLLAPKMQRVCDHCREEIFLELEALKRQAARMSMHQVRHRATRAGQLVFGQNLILEMITNNLYQKKKESY